MAEIMGSTRKQALKTILERLHAGESPAALQGAFRQAVGSITAAEIAQIEEELVAEGLPREELVRLCNLHLALFEESLAGEELPVPDWHPLHILMAEHREVLRMANRLAALARQGVVTEEQGSEARDLVHHLVASESHYVREENVLFPYLERYGVVEPPRVMWAEHDHIRRLKEAVVAALDGSGSLSQASLALSEMLASHFTKENRILFPTAMRVVPEAEWPRLRAQFDELGYCCFTPLAPPSPAVGELTPIRDPEPARAAAATVDSPLPGAVIRFATGELTPLELQAMLDSLPVDITFVAKDDRVRYFSQGKGRIFVRTPAIIGRRVQDCHPQKSVRVVEQIVADFRAGRREVAEFWLTFEGRLVHIRYYPVRSSDGEYLGVVEVTQDVTRARELQGEKRLLDEPAGAAPAREG